MDYARPRRSLLYMPGSNPRALEKARTLPADGIILDLEDAVAPAAKELARQQIVAAVTHGGYGKREILVRVNGLTTPWCRQDLAAIARLPLDGILFPKIESPEQVRTAVMVLGEVSAPAHIPIWIMAETPRCILRIDAIAGAHARVTGIMLGTADLAKDLRARDTRDRAPMLTALSLCVLAARAHGLQVLDSVHMDLEDDAGFLAACEQGRDMGFDGKTLIHPKQIETANRVFSPNETEISHARAVLAAWDQAQAEGKGVVVVNGRLVERLHVEEARRLLALAARIDEIAAAHA